MAVVGSGNKTDQKENLKTKMAFFVFGFVLYTIYALLIAAAQDILSNTNLPTTAVLIAQILPITTIQLFCPYFITKIWISVRIAIIVTFYMSGILFVSLVNEVGWKLAGVCLTSVAIGVGEMTFLSMTAFYLQETVGLYSSGSGLGYVIGLLYYTGMTTLACVTPAIALLGSLALAPGLILMFIIMDKSGKRDAVSMATEHKPVKYSSLATDADYEETSLTPYHLSNTDKLAIILKTIPFTLVLAIGVFSKYLSLQAVVTVLAFPDAPFGPRNHYLFYTTVLTLGELISRSFSVIVLTINPRWNSLTRHTWIFTSLLVSILMFLVFAAWYRFLHSVWIVMFLMFMIGVAEGALFVNTFSMTGEDEHIRDRTEFSRAFVQSGLGIGISAAALLGLSTETLLRDHCIHIVTDPNYCLTRSLWGWNATVSCLT